MLFLVSLAAATPTTEPADAPPITVSVDPRDPVIGAASARFTLAEFSDFQCPHCAGAWKPVESYIGNHKDVRLVFMSYPISDACNPAVEGLRHENACYAARAAICANEQGKFSALAGQMFGNQDFLSPEQVAFMADKVGIKAKPFAECLSAKSTSDLVARDVDTAVAAAIEGTPTFFLRDGAGPWRLQTAGVPAMLAGIDSARGAPK